MKKILIFSGTSEGRELSEKLNEKGVRTIVSVATEYGEIVMSESPLLEIVTGRLDVDGICELIREAAVEEVVDATHPFAKLITENIREACTRLGVKYLRVSREISENGGISEDMLPRLISVSSCDEAATFLSENAKGTVLLTTGVKEIKTFTKYDILKDIIYARILPSSESLTLAYEAGLKPSQIFALEGPFSEEMNVALLNKSGAKYLVTKNSGARGGFLEKLSACKKTDTICVVIEPPKDEGVSVCEALMLLAGEDNARRIDIVGIGPGNTEYLTVKVKSLIENADVFIGAKRMCEFAFAINSKAKTYEEYQPDDVSDIALSESGNIVILMSGDTGFYSGSAGILKALNERDEMAAKVAKVHPGISSVSVFASKIKKPYSDELVMSIHGREEDFSFLADERNCFVLLGDGKQVSRLLDFNEKSDRSREIKIGFNLCLATEKIFEINSRDDYDEANKVIGKQNGLFIAYIGDER